VAPPPIPAPAEALEALVPGALVSAEHLGLKGELVAVAGETATVRCGALTVRVPLTALRTVGAPAGDAGPKVASRPGAARETRSLPRDEPRGSMGKRHAQLAGDRGVARGARGLDAASYRPIPSELLLLGRTTDEARDLVEQYLDQAFMAGLATVRLVHGKGTGALRRMVRELLAAHPLVESYRDGEPSEGGTGATVAALKVD
jgi:DNA mismatch repair protein MutS2